MPKGNQWLTGSQLNQEESGGQNNNRVPRYQDDDSGNSTPVPPSSEDEYSNPTTPTAPVEEKKNAFDFDDFLRKLKEESGDKNMLQNNQSPQLPSLQNQVDDNKEDSIIEAFKKSVNILPSIDDILEEVEEKNGAIVVPHVKENGSKQDDSYDAQKRKKTDQTKRFLDDGEENEINLMPKEGGNNNSQVESSGIENEIKIPKINIFEENEINLMPKEDGNNNSQVKSSSARDGKEKPQIKRFLTGNVELRKAEGEFPHSKKAQKLSEEVNNGMNK
jgi:hypothetical protein